MNSDFGIKLDPTPKEREMIFKALFNLSQFADICFNSDIYTYDYLVEAHKIDDTHTLVLGNMSKRGCGNYWFGKLVANGSNGPKDSDKMSDYGPDIISTITSETRGEILKEISRLLPEIAASVCKV